MINKACVYSIDIYQKYISPHKGYCCAYRYYTGKDSCSEFTKKSILKYGVIKAFPLFVEQIKKCKKVYESYNTNKEIDQKASNRKKEKEIDKCNEACGVMACL